MSSHRAVGLEHGHAHDEDHQAWTRRDFLVRSGLAAAGASLVLGSGSAHATTANRALANPGLIGSLRQLETDRVLVLLQLAGGNDGLNTIVPVTDDRYYNARPSIALKQTDTIRLNDDFGLHPSLSPLESMWGDGNFGVVHSVGYEDQSLSHFDGIDVWASARETDGQTGWTAEAAAALGRGDVTVPPTVQIGASYPLLMTGPEGVEGMTLSNAGLLDQIVTSGELYNTTGLPNSSYGRQLGFLRSVANDANLYVTSLRSAGDGISNAVEYPDDQLGESLAAVARLIKGHLETRVYLVRLKGFDTHADQINRHQALLDTLGKSVAAFYEDLGTSGDDERTLTMTFSEFGRRVGENGSLGTDHGTAAPVCLFGPSVDGGFTGTAPDLATLDGAGNLPVYTDFRRVYATVLNSWLGLDATVATSILGGDYEPLGLLSAATADAPRDLTSSFELAPPAPNPVRTRSTVRYTLASSTGAELTLYDTSGRHIASLATGAHTAGTHTAQLDAHGLAAGLYVLRLQTEDGTRTQTVTVAR
ncbi:MAG: hypothetical protein Rubg2KO_14000 [Rubricoccaceae bacterium]